MVNLVSNFINGRNTITIPISFFMGFCLVACLSPHDQELKDALRLAGENRGELEKVLSHYKEDPDKLKAARFLISNMPGFYSRIDVNGKYENLYRQAEEILDATQIRDAEDTKRVKKQIDRLQLSQTPALDSVAMDLRTMTTGFLIQNIEEAFYLREHSPWCRHLTFDEFCEYILPYKVVNFFFLELWREKLSRRVSKELLDRMDTYTYSSLLTESSYWACKEVNSYLHQFQYPPHCPLAASDIYRLTILGKVPYGTCEEKVIATTGIMRSLGIPVSIGFTYQWPFRSLGHSWNILLMKNGLLTTFGGGDQGPEEMHMPEIPMAKAYKRTYAINKDMVQLLKEMKIVPDETETRDAVLKRKFFLSEVMHGYTERLIGGEFQASNQEDFSVAECIYRIEKWNNRKDSVVINSSKPYRYWRYVAPENSNGNISHIDFFADGKSITKQGKPIGTDETFFPDDRSTAKQVVFDQEPLTYFETPDSIRNPWVGMDFGQPVLVDKIVYAPRNDDNNIRPGDFYELFYWKEDWWVSLGRKTAQKDYLEYQNIPTNALFLLKNYTQGKEERIFTYTNDRQIFW